MLVATMSLILSSIDEDIKMLLIDVELVDRIYDLQEQVELARISHEGYTPEDESAFDACSHMLKILREEAMWTRHPNWSRYSYNQGQ